MYTWELQNYVNERNGVLNRDEFLKVVNRVDNPQVHDVKVENTKEGTFFHLTTTDNGDMRFRVEGVD